MYQIFTEFGTFWLYQLLTYLIGPIWLYQLLVYLIGPIR